MVSFLKIPEDRSFRSDIELQLILFIIPFVLGLIEGVNMNLFSQPFDRLEVLLINLIFAIVIILIFRPMQKTLLHFRIVLQKSQEDTIQVFKQGREFELEAARWDDEHDGTNKVKELEREFDRVPIEPSEPDKIYLLGLNQASLLCLVIYFSTILIVMALRN